jgi:hypothetical protein
MAGEAFWNNREQAQKFIDEANIIRSKVDPLTSSGRQVDDFRVMIELGMGEPPAAQTKIEQELERDVA